MNSTLPYSVLVRKDGRAEERNFGSLFLANKYAKNVKEYSSVLVIENKTGRIERKFYEKRV